MLHRSCSFSRQFRYRNLVMQRDQTLDLDRTEGMNSFIARHPFRKVGSLHCPEHLPGYLHEPLDHLSC